MALLVYVTCYVIPNNIVYPLIEEARSFVTKTAEFVIKLVKMIVEDTVKILLENAPSSAGAVINHGKSAWEVLTSGDIRLILGYYLGGGETNRYVGADGRLYQKIIPAN